MAVGFTYTIDRECPICKEKIQVTKVRSRLVKISQDTDFCVLYKDFNPYYYTVWVCSQCGYAAEESHFNTISEENKEIIAAFLLKKKIGIKFNETRTREEAVAAFKLAIYFADMTRSAPSRMAGLYLKLGWLYREGGDTELEQGVLKRALTYYDQSLSTERYPIGSMTDNAVTYLIGVLHWKTGNIEQATQYLSRVMSDRRIKMEPMVYNMARDLWQDIRAEKEKLEAEAEKPKTKKAQ